MSHAGWIPPKIRAVLHSRPSGVAHEVLLYWIPLSSLKFLQTQDLKKEPFTWRGFVCIHVLHRPYGHRCKRKMNWMKSKLPNWRKYLHNQSPPKNRLSQVPLSGLPCENSLARRRYAETFSRQSRKGGAVWHRLFSGEENMPAGAPTLRNPPCDITKARSGSTG